MPANSHVLTSLFLASIASLYTEIMLIRWISTEVRIFAYFQNLALIACFLGFGLGCYWSQRNKNPIFTLMAMAALVGLVKAPITEWQRFLRIQSSLLGLSSDAALWSEIEKNLDLFSVLPAFVAAAIVTACFLILLLVIMIPLGQLVGSYLELSKNAIKAYSVNLIGSVVGLWLLAGLSFLWLPPSSWFALSFLLVLVMQPSLKSICAGLLSLAFSLILLQSPDTDKEQTHWSPYQKLRLDDLGEQMYNIYVNNTGYMTISNLTPAFLARHPQLAKNYTQSSYDAPFRFALNRERVLILGAGAGNDAAAALRNGAGLVDCVEIDPVIYDLGKRFHPERPYSSPKVRTIVEDARAFLSRAQEQYDIILFGLLDSHTEFSSYSNMRIDNYVYTEEAFRSARRLLKPGGILILKFEVRSPWTWMGERFYTMFLNVFGRKPIVFFAPRVEPMLQATVFVSSNDSEL
jgi:spermidine synthase